MGERPRNEDEPGTDAPMPGELIDGKYRVERVIGEGGMGVVLAAHHEILDQRVAVKMMRRSAASSLDAIPRLVREARASARMRSEHCVRVMDVATHSNGLPFIVMEYLEGQDLHEILRERGPLPVEEACHYTLQALVALAEAHAHGIVHRDLKPSNLFLARRPDGSKIIKILDFGVAKSTLFTSDKVRLTSSGAIMGSPMYMSPEQIRGARDLDGRSDVWSVGVVVYELLTGALPFAGETIGGVFAAILETPYPPMRTLRPELPQGLDDVVARCVARRREERFPTVAALARALSPFAPAGGSRANIDLIEKALTTSPGSAAPPAGPASGPDVAHAATESIGDQRVTRVSPLVRTGQNVVVTSVTARSEGRPRPGVRAVAGVGAAVVAAGLVVAAASRTVPHTPTASSSQAAVSPVAPEPAPPPAAASSVASTTAGPSAPAVPGPEASTPGAPPPERSPPNPSSSTPGRPPSRPAPPPLSRTPPRKAQEPPAARPPAEIVSGGRE